VSAEDFQRQRLAALPLLLVAAIGLLIALVLLLGDGFSLACWAICAFGAFLAAIGLLKLYRRPPE
jgi:hypothetical protein